MGKYYLKISGKEIPRVSSLTTTNFFRAETRQITFSGGLAIDRGDVKKRVETSVKIMSAEEFKALETALNAIVVDTEFYYRGELVSAKMIASPITSFNEVYLYGKREKGVYYTDIKFVMEEQ